VIKKSFITVLVVLLLGCGIPKDAAGSYHKEIIGDTFRVGKLKDDPEAERWIEKFAEQAEAEIEYYEASPKELHQALLEQEIHLVYGELDQASPFLKGVAVTKPYYVKRVKVGGEKEAPDEEQLKKEGVRLQSPQDRLLARLVTGRAPNPDSPYLLITSEAKEVANLKTRVVGDPDRYVFALPPGENRLLVELDRLLWSATDEK
jgi:hypothetical protein